MTDSLKGVPASDHSVVDVGVPYWEFTVREYSCIHEAVALIGPFIVIKIGLSVLLEFVAPS